MLSTSAVDEVKRLIATHNFSLRQIAKLVGASRGSVSAIANGTRREHAPGERDEALLIPRGPVVRCAGCGGRVFSPCHLCRIRALKASERQAARQSSAGGRGFRAPTSRM